MVRPYSDLKEANEKRLLAEIKAKKTVLTALPPRCTFELSWRCNYGCKKCGYSKLDRGPEFSAADFPEWDWEDVERVAAEFFPTCRLTQSTLLGEPFLSDKFGQLMNLYSRYGVYFRPTTNGSLLTEDKFGTINGVVDWLKCSFDGHTPELYSKLHLNDSFLKVVGNLKAFSDNRRHMAPYPWFRIGIVLMRSNFMRLRDYADFVFEHIGVDEMEVMSLNYANEKMVEEFYWDLADEVNSALDDLTEHCINKKYRLRLPFARMPRKDGSWNGPTGHQRGDEIAKTQPQADNSGYEKYSNDIRAGDIFGNRQTLEKGYVWSTEMRITQIQDDEGCPVGICPAMNRPFFKPPTVEKDGKPWIKVESCGSCSTYVFGNLKESPFTEIYNSPMSQRVRAFLYRRYEVPRDEWMIPCKNCLCVDPIYRYESNGIPNVGLRFFPGDDTYQGPMVENRSDHLIKRAWKRLSEEGILSTARTTYHFIKDHCAAKGA